MDFNETEKPDGNSFYSILASVAGGDNTVASVKSTLAKYVEDHRDYVEVIILILVRHLH